MAERRPHIGAHASVDKGVELDLLATGKNMGMGAIPYRTTHWVARPKDGGNHTRHEAGKEGFGQHDEARWVVFNQPDMLDTECVRAIELEDSLPPQDQNRINEYSLHISEYVPQCPLLKSGYMLRYFESRRVPWESRSQSSI